MPPAEAALRAAPWRVAGTSLALAGLLALPWLVALRSVEGLGELPLQAVRGARAALDAVGWVLIPQVVLAVPVLGLALQRIATRLAGAPRSAPPHWIDPAVESALLLGMLGTLSGMVQGFGGLSPESLEPGPLVHALGTALRSSLIGFSIALVGVWLRAGEES